MPQIKTITVNNGTADVIYKPAGSSANSTLFMNRGSSLLGGSKITSTHPTVKSDAATQRQSLVLDKVKEVTTDGITSQRKVGLLDLRMAFDVGSSREDRVAVLEEFKSLLTDTDVINSIVDNEAFY